MKVVVATLLAAAAIVTPTWAVTTQFLKVGTAEEFDAGTLEQVVVGAGGGLRLARELKMIVEDDGKSASIDAIAEAADGTVYYGTAATGRLMSIRDGKPTTLADFGEGASVSALAFDAGGDLLIGVSGEHAELQSLKRGAAKPERVCTLDDAQYVWSIATTPDGTALVGTGPTGKLFAVDRGAKSARVLFDSTEDNLRCVAVHNDMVFVGTDPNGLVLRVDRATGAATVVQDAAETEVSALLIDDRTGSLFVGTSQLVEAAAPAVTTEASGGHAATGDDAAATLPVEPAKDEPKPPKGEPRPGELRGVEPTPPADAEPPTAIAATTQPEAPSAAGPKPMTPAADGAPAANGNAVYRVDSQGFVSEVFRAPAMVFALARVGDDLLVATGPEGTLYSVDLNADEHSAIARVESTAITALATGKSDAVWLGTGDGATLAQLAPGIATSGTFTSGVLDAAQVAAFGKLQVRGTVGDGNAMTVSTRSSNVSDGDSPLWAPWSEPVPAARFVGVATPAGRYAQVRVAMTSDGKSAGPTLDALELAYVRPNVAPRIESVTVVRPAPEGEATEQPNRTVEWQAVDANGDAMRFDVSVRTAGQPWTTIARDISEATYAWDTRRVPDGRYEVKVTASDALGNAEGQGKTASRQADAVDVDNTPPTIGDVKQDRAGGKLTVSARVVDRGGIVARLEYRLDDAKDWQTAPASDNLDDSPDERYAIVLPDPGAATRVLSLRGRDAAGNTAYASVTLRPAK